ncbi:LacI family DNA-binding transcriptional regulator [Kineococcus sp. SYSU DK004]|uniref:LacI family DNA-binding transcriptional regulator n=1 Tax=Kineococcus sp. SYSU DK004 TaxID=3383125 RepID=UPI003D7F0DD9
MARRATSQDVAKLAGVSRSAVSMVLNGRGAGNIAVDKQAAILRAAAELDYTPNSVALSLRTQRTRTLGVVTDAIATSAFGGRLLEGAARTAEDAGHVLVVLDTHHDEERERQAFQTLLDRRVDALLFAAMTHREYDVPDVMRTLPAVLADAYDPAGRVTGYVPDEVAGGARQVRAVLDAGHRDVVALDGTPEVPGQHYRVVAADQRAQGLAAAIAEAGLAPLRRVVTGWDIAAGHRAAVEVLAGPDRPTALVCANDRVAVGAVLAAASLGLSVPHDVSVVGYDDDENVAPVLVPALTTVRLPFREMGERAVAHLLSELDGDGAATPGTSRVLLECPLVERGSIAPPSR